MRFPKYVAVSPRNTLRLVYSAKRKKSPSLRRAIFSFAKVEKVVNPPQKPTVRNNRQSEFIISPFSDSPKNKPIRKQPKTFIRNVPNGNADRK